MRQGQNKRMRGRNGNNNNNRKGPNPLTRSYESNGPDVKIRGTAHHVAEKYLQLARDAQTSGDPVMAESYLQHAEHYFRLIATAQLAQQQAQPGYNRPPGEIDAEEDDEDDFGGLPDRFASPQERQPTPPIQNQPPNNFYNGQPQAQPFAERPAYNGERQDNRPDQPRQDNRGARPDRPPFKDRGYGDRNSYQDRNMQDRGNGRDRQNGERPPQHNQNRNNQDMRRPRDFRPDPYRQEQPRFDNPRPDQVRFEIARTEPIAPPEPRVEQPRIEQPRIEQPRPEPRAEQPRPEPPRAPNFEAATALPAFITAPVRLPEPAPAAPAAADAAIGEDAAKPRRRRRTRAEIDADNARAAASKADVGE